MKLLSARQVSSFALLSIVTVAGVASAQHNRIQSVAETTATDPQTAALKSVRAFPQLHLHGGLELTYLGMFSPDAVYRPHSGATGTGAAVPGEGIEPAATARGGAPASIAPEWMLLSSERLAENFEPPGRAQAAPRATTPAASIRNHLLTYAYGRISVMNWPRALVTDSQGRVVISDPGANAVHVLDPRGKTSFRLVCGKGYRVHRPSGVAVDGENNIYVADPEHGMIVVFDQYGNFQRYIGNYRGEPEYARPQAIAIDVARRHLFVVDSPRNMVFELDLDGNELKRLGKNRRGEGVGEFDAPTDIALNQHHIYVLDRWGMRVQVLDKDFTPVGSFDLPGLREPQRNHQISLATDEEGRVYVSGFLDASVHVYSPVGKLLSGFGQTGTKAGQFAQPGGLWVDGRNRLYVADSGNGRVQMFQITSPSVLSDLSESGSAGASAE